MTLPAAARGAQPSTAGAGRLGSGGCSVGMSAVRGRGFGATQKALAATLARFEELAHCVNHLATQAPIVLFSQGDDRLVDISRKTDVDSHGLSLHVASLAGPLVLYPSLSSFVTICGYNEYRDRGESS